MQIDKEAEKRLLNHLNSNWKNSTCPMCGGQLGLENKIFELREFNKGDLVVGGPNNSIIPIVPVTCRKCGFTIFVNAIVSHVVVPNNTKKNNDSKEEQNNSNLQSTQSFISHF